MDVLFVLLMLLGAGLLLGLPAIVTAACLDARHRDTVKRRQQERALHPGPQLRQPRKIEVAPERF